MTKIVKLIMVSGDNNNNKYYHMFEQNDGTFTVNYGRVDSTAQHSSYPMSQWDKKKNEKLHNFIFLIHCYYFFWANNP